MDIQSINVHEETRMSDLTRRTAFMLGAGGALAAACATPPSPGAPPNRVAFRHGVASGDPTQTRLIIWTRVTPEQDTAIEVGWRVASDPEFKTIVREGAVRTGPERDFTVKADVDGLEPGREYFYWFFSGDVASPAGRARTLAQSGVDPFRMAVVSCSNLPFGYFNAYRDIARRGDIQAVVHTGDYLYEYGRDGYGGEVGRRIGREHEPATETVSLEDYRKRHAQYKADPDLQAAHAACVWFCTWDDHESTNNSYRTGAENHQPDKEGDWSERKAAAVQAYLEWMPVRDPEPGRAREALWRRFEIGDLATLLLLESRLTGRGEDLTLASFAASAPGDRQAAADALLARVNDPQRTMLGFEQEAWLAAALESSSASGKIWQVLGNQVTMAKVRLPDLEAKLAPEQLRQLPPATPVRFTSGRYGLPWNLDAWGGFPEARRRLYQAAKKARSRLVTLTGDTHTAWANELHDDDGWRLGVEFGCTSVTSPGMGESIPFREINWLMAEANDEVAYYNAFDKGCTVVSLMPDRVEAEFVKVSTVLSQDYFASVDARFFAVPAETGVGPLQRPMSSQSVVSAGGL
jgi:alkaline phosphatase D